MRRSYLLAFLCLYGALSQRGHASQETQEQQHQASSNDLLLEFQQRGGLYGFRIGKPCEMCERGAIATRDYRVNETVAQVVLGPGVAVDLGYPARTLSRDPATALAKMIHRDPSFNATFALFLDSLPGREEIFSAELFEEEHIDLLQSRAAAALVQRKQDHDRAHYKALKLTDPSIPVTWADYEYLCAIVSTRNFVVADDPDNERSEQRWWLVPGLDMVNAADSPSVRRVDRPGGVLELLAARDITEGEELTMSYGSENRKPDASLLQYGFVEEREPPVLALVDQVGYSQRAPWVDTELYAETLYAGPRGPANELRRISALLASLPTTEEEDRALLAAEAALPSERRDRRRELLLRFRVERKRALAWRAQRAMRESAGGGGRGRGGGRGSGGGEL